MAAAFACASWPGGDDCTAAATSSWFSGRPRYSTWGATWASGQYARTFFGIDAQQSARSGLPQHEAGRGLNSVRLSVGAMYVMTLNWTAGARAARARLVGDAADSPVIASRWQNNFATFLSYRF